MKPTRLFLIRHGEVELEAQGSFNGHRDIGLSDHGRDQYRQLKKALDKEPVEVVFSSDLRRALEGADYLAQAFGVPLEVRPQLREMDFGAWDGKRWPEIAQEFPDECQARLDDPVNFQMPGGESLLQLQKRLLDVQGEILNDFSGKTVLVVAHGGANRVLLLNALGAPLDRLFSLEQRYGCYNLLQFFGDGASVLQTLNRVPGEEGYG